MTIKELARARADDPNVKTAYGKMANSVGYEIALAIKARARKMGEAG